MLPTEGIRGNCPAYFVTRPQNYESGRNNVLTTLSKVPNALTTLFAAVDEDFYKAEQYEALARKSDRELAVARPLA
jgi:hypothetical protein